MKKNLNKVLALTLAFTVVGSTAAYAEVMKGETTATPVPISADADDQAEASAYISNTGKITEVADTEDGNKVFTMDNENGGLRFVVAPTTTIVDRETGSVITADKLTEGMEVAVIYGANAPMGMSMPPYMGQVTAVVANADKGSISVGHFNDDLLKLSERYEKFGSGEQIFERLQYAQELFPTCNIDMMFGFRGQTLDMLHEDMEKIWKLNPRQVTTYPLMVTSQTRKSVKNVIAASGNQLADQYRVILDTLGSRYNHLTSWTFGRTHDEGFDEYVVDYDEYLGVGSGAFSFLNDSLYVNTFSLRRYNERIAAGNTGVERRRQFDKHAILQYRLMLGLFSHRLSRKYFREVHGVNLDRTLMKEMLALRVAGAIKDDPNDPDNIIVTDGGKFLGLVMMKAFYSAMDNVRAELRQPLKEEDYS